MKTTRVEKAIKCDKCKKVYGQYEGEVCLGCGKDYCRSCAANHGEEYEHSVYCSGSGDGFYCKKCDVQLEFDGDKKHAAYTAIKRLRAEYREWCASFEARRTAAEEHLKSLTEA